MPPAHDARAGIVGRERKGCPPHGPHLIDAVEEWLSYTARCLKCGPVGPERNDALGAKLAFDQS
jgi:hypothetical protein